MQKYLFITTNSDKFNKTKINLHQYGIQLVQEHLEMQEIQTSNGEEIARQKAIQAYEHFRQPVLVNDDTWEIRALKGFPSTAMKLCNEFLTADDWLRLMQGKMDRHVRLVSHYAYNDGQSIRTLHNVDERIFLSQSRGIHTKSSCLQVIGRVGSSMSIAEEIERGIEVDTRHAQFWKKLAELMKNG
jgi:XTP/dITP diphosphohydrolase